MEIITPLIALVAAAQVHGAAVTRHVLTLPPTPEKAAITCHDIRWERANLKPVQDQMIHKNLQPYITQLLTDAAQAGHMLSIASAYRNCPTQTNLRVVNCGAGDYNILRKPFNLCTPPTEPAGSSLHNEGLAIDLACSGYALFETSPCYAWLQKQGANYRLKEHRLEPWHWSTTGD